MVSLSALWLAILLAAVFVFIASSIIHIALPIHRTDYGQLPGEDAVRKAIREAGVQRGQYMFPHCSDMKELGSEEMTAKFVEGPVGHMVILESGPIKMGKNLLHWFLYSIVVSAIAGYVAGIGNGPGADGMVVFRVAGTVAFAAYAGSVVDSIWKGIRWSVSLKFVMDALVYGVVTGATLAWLWPAAS